MRRDVPGAHAAASWRSCAAGTTSAATAPPPGRARSVASPPQPRASARAIGSPRPVPGAAPRGARAAMEALEQQLLLAGAGPGAAITDLDQAGRGDDLDLAARAA